MGINAELRRANLCGRCNSAFTIRLGSLRKINANATKRCRGARQSLPAHVQVYQSVSLWLLTCDDDETFCSPSASMPRLYFASLAFVLLAGGPAAAQSYAVAPGAMPPPPQMVVAAPPPPPMRSELGGGFIEFLFGAHNVGRSAPPPPPSPTRRRRRALRQRRAGRSHAGAAARAALSDGSAIPAPGGRL